MTRTVKSGFLCQTRGDAQTRQTTASDDVVELLAGHPEGIGDERGSRVQRLRDESDCGCSKKERGEDLEPHTAEAIKRKRGGEKKRKGKERGVIFYTTV